MKKIIIIGSGGAGKSTLARKLGKQLNLPVYHLDAIFWKPGWTETPREEWTNIQKKLVEIDEWIIDGNYGGTMDLRMKAADTIIFLDYSSWISFFRVIKRQVMYRNQTRPDMGADCPEKLDPEFVKWVWNFRRDKRPGILKKLKEVSKDKNVIILKSPKDTDILLEQLKCSF